MANLIGFSMMHIAKMNGDGTYTKPKRIHGAVAGSIDPSPAQKAFGTQGDLETQARLCTIPGTFTVADLSPELEAYMFGHTYEGGMLKRSESDRAPNIAIGWRCLKTTGAYRYCWLVYGKMWLVNTKGTTKTDNIEYGTAELAGNFGSRRKDGLWIVVADSDDPNISQSVIDGWFESVK